MHTHAGRRGVAWRCDNTRTCAGCRVPRSHLLGCAWPGRGAWRGVAGRWHRGSLTAALQMTTLDFIWTCRGRQRWVGLSADWSPAGTGGTGGCWSQSPGALQLLGEQGHAAAAGAAAGGGEDGVAGLLVEVRCSRPSSQSDGGGGGGRPCQGEGPGPGTLLPPAGGHCHPQQPASSQGAGGARADCYSRLQPRPHPPSGAPPSWPPPPARSPTRLPVQGQRPRRR